MMMDENINARGLALGGGPSFALRHSGPLLKRSAKWGSLKRRHFYLAGGVLEYFLDAEGRGDKGGMVRKGQISLCNAVVEYTKASMEESGKGSGGGLRQVLDRLSLGEAGGDVGGEGLRHSFAIRSSRKVLQLYAEDRESMDKWVRMLRKCATYDPGNSEAPPIQMFGWLEKSSTRGVTVRVPTLRFLQLVGPCLECFADSTDPKAVKRIDLDGVRIGKSTEQDNTVFVAKKKIVWYFKAPSQPECEQWLKKLGQQAKPLPGGPEGVQREGWLRAPLKTGGELQRTYCVALRGLLKFFHNESLAVPLGGVDLPAGTAVQAWDGDEGANLDVTPTGQGCVRLRGLPPRERDAWEAALSRCLPGSHLM